MAMQRPQRRYTPRRRQREEQSDAVHKEAKMLAEQAEGRLRLTDEEYARLEAIESPVDKLEALLDIADELAKTASPGVVKHWLPCGPWWRRRLEDLREGRTFQIRKIVMRDGVPVNVPAHPEGDPR